jgi:hypothetical protein
MTGRSGWFLAVQKFVWWVAPLLAVCMVGCGGSEYRFPGHKPKPEVTGVTAVCSPSTIQPNQTSQCTATVTGQGSFNPAVSWSASAGQISTAGLFTAPSLPTSVTITATSQWDPTQSGTFTVTVGNSTTSNVAPIVVDAGPAPQTFITANVAFVTVTVCVPGTSTCQNIDHVLVDTGSSGLRLLSSASGGQLGIALPNEPDSSGNPLLECALFGGGYTWGNVAQADITVAGEVASAAPVQVIIPSTSSPPVPTSCSSQTTQPNMGDSVQALGANGILGVGLFQQDCGPACTTANRTIPAVYYVCRSIGCSPTYVTLAQEVTNPVTLFATDNNGVLITLPAVPNGGSLNPNGSLIFGIGTQANNGLGSVTVYTVPDSGTNAGDITTTFSGTSYPASFIDSGSNGIFFLDTGTTGIPLCAPPDDSWYCPTRSPDNLSAVNQGVNGNHGTVNFAVEDAITLFSGGNTAFSTLAGPIPDSFDWGLTFFFGRNMFTAIENMDTPGGPGPYYAY